ncbi:MAG TPA: hypothetical protein VL832_19985 [Puia sp.]|nr:hypothetical protein [Puia sp.]
MYRPSICTACGTQYPAGKTPEVCPICADDRQYLPENGQHWTSHEELLQNYSVRILPLHERLYELTIAPTFAIGQRALLVLSDQGNILWDCIPLLNEPTRAFIESKGGLKAIAFSHPHYYSNVTDWAAAFDCPVHIHHRDAEWITQKDKRIQLWEGEEKALWEGMRLHHIGGHFPGSSVLEAPFLSKEGALCCGDTLVLSPSKRHLSVMYSYPNRIPLPLSEMRRIQQRFEALSFDAYYGYAPGHNIIAGVKGLLKESMSRYC